MCFSQIPRLGNYAADVACGAAASYQNREALLLRKYTQLPGATPEQRLHSTVRKGIISLNDCFNGLLIQIPDHKTANTNAAIRQNRKGPT